MDTKIISLITTRTTDNFVELLKKQKYLYFGIFRRLFRGSFATVHFLTIPGTKAIYIVNPKCGSSTIKQSMLSLDHPEIALDGHRVIHDHCKNMGYMKSQLPTDVDSFFVFTFVRNPLERIVSLYRNKFLDHEKVSRYGFVYTNYLGGLIHRDDSFTTFCRKISQIPDNLAERHFKSQSSLIYGQDIQIDFVGKMENFESDFLTVSEKTGLQMPVQRNKTGAHIAKPEVTEEIYDLIYLRYAKDYAEFYPEMLINDKS